MRVAYILTNRRAKESIPCAPRVLQFQYLSRQEKIYFIAAVGVVVAAPLPRASTAPLASSGVAVELEELLPETAENGTISHTTVLLGETVLMPCKAYSLGQRTVKS